MYDGIETGTCLTPARASRACRARLLDRGCSSSPRLRWDGEARFNCGRHSPTLGEPQLRREGWEGISRRRRRRQLHPRWSHTMVIAQFITSLATVTRNHHRSKTPAIQEGWAQDPYYGSATAASMVHLRRTLHNVAGRCHFMPVILHGLALSKRSRFEKSRVIDEFVSHISRGGLQNRISPGEYQQFPFGAVEASVWVAAV